MSKNMSQLCFCRVIVLFEVHLYLFFCILQCFDAVGWAAGRASGL